MRDLVLLAWDLVTANPLVALVGLWLGVGKLGAASAAVKAVSKVPWWLVAPVAVWVLARRYKGGRRGLAIAAPWMLTGVWLLVFWLAPGKRTALLAPVLVVAVVSGILGMDRWLGHRPWTMENVRRAWARDEATLAFRSAIGIVTGDGRATTGQVRRLPDGRHAIKVKVPIGSSVPALQQAARDGRLGAAANVFGLGLADVAVNPLPDQGHAEVVGKVVGSADVLHEVRRHPGIGGES